MARTGSREESGSRRFTVKDWSYDVVSGEYSDFADYSKPSRSRNRKGKNKAPRNKKQREERD